MFNTRIGLTDNTRQISISVLQAALVDALNLRLAVKQAHWVVRGPRFQQLHELFDSFVEPLDNNTDEMAERIATLGGTADGRVTTISRASRLDPYPHDAIDGDSHLTALAERFAALGNQVRQGIEETDVAGDMVTADLLTGVVRDLDQKLWVLEAHLGT